MGYLASKDKDLGNLYFTTPNSSCYLSNLKTEYDGFNSGCSNVIQSILLSQLILLFVLDYILW